MTWSCPLTNPIFGAAVFAGMSFIGALIGESRVAVELINPAVLNAHGLG
jgi:hypothetical protein